MSTAQLTLARDTDSTGQYTNYSITQNQPTSCDICYNDFSDDIVFLPCFHHLCHDCFCKLEKSVCPWCRHDFSNELSRDRSTPHNHHTPHHNHHHPYPITPLQPIQHNNHHNHHDISEQIFRIENKREHRQQQLQRRHINKQRQKQQRQQLQQQRQIDSSEFYDFFRIFNQPVENIENSENTPPRWQQPRWQPSAAAVKKTKKINHRLDKNKNYHNNNMSILAFR